MNTVQAGQWWDHMWGSAGAWGWMTLMMVFWGLVLLLLIWAALRIGRGQVWGDRGDRQPGGAGRASEILRERYARGEIDRETYQRMIEDLRRAGPAE